MLRGLAPYGVTGRYAAFPVTAEQDWYRALTTGPQALTIHLGACGNSLIVICQCAVARRVVAP